MGKRRVLFCGEASFLSTGFATYNREILNRLYATGKYELAEMGSYANGADQRANDLPWKFYGVLPINDHEKQIYESNPVNQFGKYKIDSVLADFQPDIVMDCVPPGELIKTKNGYIPIEDISTGDMVLTHKGRYRKVLSSWGRKYNGDIVSIYVNGNREPLTVTANHPVYVFRKRNQTNQKKSWSKIYGNACPEFVAASDVSVGDLVTFPGTKFCSQEFIIDISNYIDNCVIVGNTVRRRCKNNTPIRKSIKMDNKFARLIGYILGDGYIGDRSLTITFDRDEVDFISDAQIIIEKLFGIESSIYLDKNKYCTTVIANSSTLCEFLSKYLKDKHIPSELFFSSSDIKKALISGLIRSDGCYKKKTVSFSNTKRHLVYEYRAICTSIGIPTNLTYTDKNKCKRIYEVSTFGVESENLSSFVNKYSFDSQNAVITKSSRCARRTQIINGFLVSSVKKIEKKKYSGFVYNCEVEEDNSYCIGSYITHNCRDPWMFEHLGSAKFRDNYKLVLMPTVDSAPQRAEWIKGIFTNADVLTTYSRFGKRILEAAALNVQDVTSPGVDLDKFKPLDKQYVRDKFCIQNSLFIFGTVMRNQKRKLFPDLFDAYAKLRFKHAVRQRVARAKDKIKKGKKLSTMEKHALRIEHSVLYCHTSWPDIGWDIPQYLGRTQLQRHVIFTYKCDACGKVFASWFTPCDKKGMCVCRICGAPKAHMPTTHNGIDEKDLIEVFNLFDVYIQPAICEGWGLPIMESKACGIPGLYQNYSAMEDHVENGGGLPIKVQRLYHEAETTAKRSLPDIDDMASKMEMLAFDDEKRTRLGKQARSCAERMHNWDSTADKLDKIFSDIEINDRGKTWDRPPEFQLVTNESPPQNCSDEEFINWLYINILGREAEEQGFADWINSLRNGGNRLEVEAFFREQINAHNKFEEVRWMHSLKNRGMPAEVDPVESNKDIIPGVLL